MLRLCHDKRNHPVNIIVKSCIVADFYRFYQLIGQVCSVGSGHNRITVNQGVSLFFISIFAGRKFLNDVIIVFYKFFNTFHKTIIRHGESPFIKLP